MTSVQPSAKLQAFADDYPWERGTILAYMLRVAGEIPAGARILDVGAGDQPYRELFAHARYECCDWEHSVHPGARRVDYVAPADDLPIEDGTFDAVICTQVLEHVAEPADVLAELFRVLRPGGVAYLTVPLAWEEHEAPYDFYRYTRFGLAHLLQGAGFQEVAVEPRNDTFGTLAQLLRNAGGVMGRTPDGRDPQRDLAAHTLRHLSDLVASYTPLDVDHIFPLGYQARAVRHAPVGRAACRAACGIEDAREAAYAASADELLAEPALLAAYAAHVTGDDPISLVVYGGEGDPATVGARISDAAQAAGLLDDCAADVVAVALGATLDEAALAGAVDGVLTLRRRHGPLARLPWFDAEMAEGLALHGRRRAAAVGVAG
jgi:SAM-dependent methyltransferase